MNKINESNKMKFKYMRIQGREKAKYTDYANGVFGIFRDFEKNNVMNDEDLDLYKEILEFFTNELPFPTMCNEHQKVICFFKTENTEKMMKYMNPFLWLMERYNHPYDVVYTNFPGKIVYEDKYQIVVDVDKLKYEKIDYLESDEII